MFITWAIDASAHPDAASRSGMPRVYLSGGFRHEAARSTHPVVGHERACAFAASDPAVGSAKNGMVVSSQHFASQIGVDILKEGGNAVDAAVAVGYAQAVTNPCCGNTAAAVS